MASNDASQDELSRLKAELALVTQSRDDFKAQLTKLAPALQPPEPKPPCYFLELIPIEIRNQIYGELLLNPILGTDESVKGDPNSVKYNLSPSILPTCRQVHQEASDILYGRNTFIIVCMRESYDVPDLSPLTRKWIEQMLDIGYLNIEKLCNFEKVQHWRILASHSNIQHGGQYPCTTRVWSMKKFCEGLRHAAPKSLEILVIPDLLHAGWERIQVDWAKGSFEDMLEPLRLLRNIGSLILKSASPEDVKCLSHFKRDKSEYQVTDSDLPPLSLEIPLRQLITGEAPVELLLNMYDCLFNYARSFERYDPLSPK
jgi:hypothetical protein